MQNLQTVTTNNNGEWIQSCVKDLTYHPQYGWTTSAKNLPNGLKLLRTTDISKEQVNWDTVPVCTTEPNEKEKYLIREEDILVSRAGSIGLSYYVQNPPPAVFASYLIRFRALPDKIRAKLLYYFFQSPLYWSAIGAGELGIAIPNVNATKLGEIEVSYPTSFDEQDKLIARLDYLLPNVADTKNKVYKTRKIINKFRQSVLSAAVTGKLTETWRIKNKTEDWIRLPAEKVCGFITKGTTPKNLVKESKDNVPYLKVYNIRDNKIDFYFNPSYVDKNTHNGLLKRSIVYPNDVLMNIVGPPLYKVAIVPNDFPEWNVNQAIAIFRALDVIKPRFLQMVLTCESYVSEILSLTRGVAGQSNISLQQCRDIPIPLPTLSEQIEIIRQVDKLLYFADIVEKQIKIADERTDKLTQSILAKAFRGEL